jgi:septum formation protein
MKQPLILASGSKARKAMLTQAGLVFDVIPADIDEAAVLKNLQGKLPPEEIAAELARRKALAVASDNQETLVIGADQMLVCAGRIYSKAKTKEEARENLKNLRGRTHQLISAVCVAHGDEIMWSHTDTASLTMRGFDDDFFNDYMDAAGDALLNSVGGYELEGLGATLFERTEGDYFTILGLPLLPLLGFLLREGYRP